MILEGIVALMALAVAVLAWEDHGINRKYALLVDRLGGGEVAAATSVKVSVPAKAVEKVDPQKSQKDCEKWLTTPEARGESPRKTELVESNAVLSEPKSAEVVSVAVTESVKKPIEAVPVQEAKASEPDKVSGAKDEKKGKFDMKGFVESRPES